MSRDEVASPGGEMSGEPSKVAFEIPRELHNKLNDVLPWGTKTHVFLRLTEMVISSVERHGSKMIGALLSGELTFSVVHKMNEPIMPRAEASLDKGKDTKHVHKTGRSTEKRHGDVNGRTNEPRPKHPKGPAHKQTRAELPEGVRPTPRHSSKEIT